MGIEVKNEETRTNYSARRPRIGVATFFDSANLIFLQRQSTTVLTEIFVSR